MKHKLLSDYLCSIKSFLDKEELSKVKRYGEEALNKLTSFSCSHLEAYQLYIRLAYAYHHLAEYSRSLDMAYSAYLISSKHHLAPEQIAYSIFMLGHNFLCINSFKKAISQYQKVEEYYQKYGDGISLMDKQRHFYLLVGLGYCYFNEGELEKLEEIIQEKLPAYQNAVNDFSEYYNLNGVYQQERKEYVQARQSFQKFVAINEQLNFPVSAFVGKICLATLDLLEGHLDIAIESLRTVIKETKRLKINRQFGDASLLLSKCYYLKNMPAKARAIEKRIKPLLSKLDIIWLYETKRELEKLYHDLQPIYKNLKSEMKAIPTVLANTLNKYYKSLSYTENIIGETTAMQEVYQLIEKIAPTDLPIVIQGETGTGKELIARAIHDHSLRREKPWLALNCGAVPESLVESELFGHTKGAFTDAYQDKKGYIELASDGTLFVDEIADMSSGMQQKLLRVLEEKIIWRVSAQKPTPINTRFIFATNQNIEELVRRKIFREDLFYRINTILVTLPPLRDKKDDIPLLMKYFLKKYAFSIARHSEHNKESIPEISSDNLDLLMHYPWPGNVRELENEIKRICTLYPTASFITESMFSESIRNYIPNSSPFSLCKERVGLKELRNEFERNVIKEVLKKCNGNVSEAARQLKYDRADLYKKMKQLKIQLG